MSPDPTDAGTTLPPDTASFPTAPAGGPPAAEPGPPAPPGYVVAEELGRGGMGVVYKATQRGLNRPVAVKMVLTSDHCDPKELIRFLAEAEAVAAVKHPHVVQVYEFGEHRGRPFLAMEYLPGGSLADRLRLAGPPTPRAAAELAEKLARAVHAAHEQGIVHRDLKPGNVLFDADGQPKVTDFGLAKRGGAADLTRTGAVMGTPAYMAPEQAQGRTKFVGPAADVYALGVVLFELLTGRRPFDDPDPVALLMKVAAEDPPPVRRLAPHAPKELALVCRKCLAKDPRDRYPSAAALAADLAHFLAGEPISGARQSVFDRVRSTLDRTKNAAEFAEYAHVFFWLAGLVVVGEAVNTLCVQHVLPSYVIRVGNYLRVLALVGLLAYYRRGHVLPQTGLERYLWAVWGGFLVTCAMNGVCHWLRREGWSWDREAELYQSNALLAALAFFSLAPAFWGWCYAFGGVFLAASVVMAMDLSWAPLEYGTAWAGILVVTGLRLRRLARVK